jgi:hypothetical protein
MSYNLTDNQKEICKWLVGESKKGKLPDEFYFDLFTHKNKILVNRQLPEFTIEQPEITKGTIEVLRKERLLTYKNIRGKPSGYYPQMLIGLLVTLRGQLFKAVESDFGSPDTLFTQYLTPLSDLTYLDKEIIDRCLPTLSVDSANPKNWDTAIRNAVVILEERLRDIGNIPDSNRRGKPLVNYLFGKNGTMINKFKDDSEREGYRDLYAGIVSIFRNAYTHRLIDPSPEDGGEVLGFINLLLKMLENLR